MNILITILYSIHTHNFVNIYKNVLRFIIALIADYFYFFSIICVCTEIISDDKKKM